MEGKLKLEDLKNHLNKTSSTMSSEVLVLNGIIERLLSSSAPLEGELRDIQTPIQTVTREVEALGDNVTSLTQDNENLENDIKNATQNREESTQRNESLVSQEKELAGKVAELDSGIADLKSQIETAQKQLSLKEETYNNLTSNLDKEYEKAVVELDEAKKKSADADDRYPGMHFMFKTSLESVPRAEILAIIAEKEPVSSNEIKKAVEHVSPVQVMRFITMLEADGKIRSEDEKWVLNMEL